MPNFIHFGFWASPVSWDEVTLIQTFFCLVVFTSAIRPRQNLNSKIGPKLCSWSSIFVFIYICVNTQISKKTDPCVNKWVSTLNFWCCWAKHTTYRESILCFGIDICKLESIFDGSGIDFPKIKTKLKKMWKFWNYQILKLSDGGHKNYKRRKDLYK